MVKKFFLNLFIYIILFIIVSNLFALAVINIPALSKVLDFAPEVYVANINSKKTITSDTIILGDSVAHQIFKSSMGIKDSFYDLTTNQAVSLAGQYILIKNAIDNNTSIKEVYLIYHPRSFSNDLDQIWTFDYFVKPFYNFKDRKYFSQSVIKHLENIKLYKMAIFPIIKVIPNFPSLDYSRFISNSSKNRSFLSNTSVEYLIKIEEACKDKGINFKVIACPVRESSIDDYSTFKKQINDNGLQGIFKDYFKEMVISEDNLYIDDFHLKKDYIANNRQSIIDNLIN